MARITLRQLLDHAAEHGYGVPAVNIDPRIATAKTA
jgi:fructose-bisphosphate aldolase class II